jgi:hypothetical protein
MKRLAAAAIAAAGFVACVPCGQAKPVLPNGSAYGPVLSSARVVLYDREQKPRVELRLPAGFKRRAANAGSVLDRFRLHLLGALDRALAQSAKTTGGDHPGFLEDVLVTFHGCSEPGCAEVEYHLPTGYRSNAPDAAAQRKHYRADILRALDGRLRTLGWRSR